MYDPQAASGFEYAMGTDEEPEFVPSRIANTICAMTSIAAFNSIGMAGGYAFDPANGESGYKRMKGLEPVRTKDGWTTMLPYATQSHARTISTCCMRACARLLPTAPTRSGLSGRITG